MAPIQITFLYDKGSAVGRTRAEAMDRILYAYRSDLPSFTKPRHLDLREPLIFADINIHLDIPVFGAMRWAHVNVALQHTDAASVEAWAEAWDAYRPSLDEVWPAALVEAGPSAELLGRLKALFARIGERQPKRGDPHLHCPPILHTEDCPPISIVTPTYNRRKLVDIAFHNLMATDYPADKIEWVIVEDNEDPAAMASDRFMNFQVNNPKMVVKYIPIQGRMSIGQKRNIGVENASHDIIVFMDDDDHYPVTSLRRRVAWLTKARKGGVDCGGDIAFCTTIALYDLVRGVSAVNVPPYGLPLGKRISEATLTFRKSAWVERKFEEVSIAEGDAWIAGRESACVEMPPQQIIVAFSHRENASSRRVPPSELKEIACFWGFPKEYLVFVHRLVGIELEESEESRRGEVRGVRGQGRR